MEKEPGEPNQEDLKKSLAEKILEKAIQDGDLSKRSLEELLQTFEDNPEPENPESDERCIKMIEDELKRIKEEGEK